MPQDVAELVSLLDLKDLGRRRFRGEHPETQMQRSFGGQVLAQALAAMYRTVPEDRLCHSLSGYFLQPGSTTSSIVYDVQLTREGRSFATRRVVAEQAGRTIFVMSASFKQAEDGFEHQVAAYQPPAPPELCPPLAVVLGSRSATAQEHWEEEWGGALDVRFADSTPATAVEQSARMLVWVKTTGSLDADPRLHQQILAYESDLTILAVSTLTHPIDFYSRRLQAATINHTMWFHRNIRADGWVLYDQMSPNASNALGFSLGRLYSRNVLGASCAQEGLIRVVNPDKAFGS